MLIVALVVFAVTAWFLGLKPGMMAGGVSLGLLVVAGLMPLAPIGIAIYLLHVAWIAGLWYLGGKVQRARARTRPWSQAQGWVMRGWSLWNKRK